MFVNSTGTYQFLLDNSNVRYYNILIYIHIYNLIISIKVQKK